MAHTLPSIAVCKQIIADLGYEERSPESFNDDDWYEYRPRTLMFIAQYPRSMWRDAPSPRPGNVIGRGMDVKHLGLIFKCAEVDA